jgi:hypothetical protein
VILPRCSGPGTSIKACGRDRGIDRDQALFSRPFLAEGIMALPIQLSVN